MHGQIAKILKSGWSFHYLVKGLNSFANDRLLMITAISDFVQRCKGFRIVFKFSPSEVFPYMVLSNQ